MQLLGKQTILAEACLACAVRRIVTDERPTDICSLFTVLFQISRFPIPFYTFSPLRTASDVCQGCRGSLSELLMKQYDLRERRA